MTEPTHDLSRSTRRTVLRSTTAIAAVALAGCTGALSGDDTEVEDYALPEASASVEVEMGPDRSDRFAPEIVHVEPGGEVTWTNVSRNHSATAYHPDNGAPRRMPADVDPWDTGVLRENGKSVTHTFEVPGVYDYYCTPHEPLGMLGTVVVGDPDPADQPGLSAPGEGVARDARGKLETLNAKVRAALEG